MWGMFTQEGIQRKTEGRFGSAKQNKTYVLSMFFQYHVNWVR